MVKQSMKRLGGPLRQKTSLLPSRVGSSNKKYTITKRDAGKVFSVFDTKTGKHLSIEKVCKVTKRSYQYLQHLSEMKKVPMTDPRCSSGRWYFVQMSKLEQILVFGRVWEKE